MKQKDFMFATIMLLATIVVSYWVSFYVVKTIVDDEIHTDIQASLHNSNSYNLPTANDRGGGVAHFYTNDNVSVTMYVNDFEERRYYGEIIAKTMYKDLKDNPFIVRDTTNNI